MRAGKSGTFLNSHKFPLGLLQLSLQHVILSIQSQDGVIPLLHYLLQLEHLVEKVAVRHVKETLLLLVAGWVGVVGR